MTKKEYQKQYYLKNKHWLKVYKKGHYEINSEAYKANSKVRYKRMKEEYNAMTEEEIKKAKVKAYNKEYYQKRKLKELEECIVKTKGNK